MKFVLVLSLLAGTIYLLFLSEGIEEQAVSDTSSALSAENLAKAKKLLKDRRKEISILPSSQISQKNEVNGQVTKNTAQKKTNKLETAAAYKSVLHSMGVNEEMLQQDKLQIDQQDGGEQGTESNADLLFSTDREGIQSAMKEMAGKLKECYEGWLQTNPEIQGRMQVVFSIKPHQSDTQEEQVPNDQVYADISESYLSVDSVKHPMMSGCLLNLVDNLKFENVEKPLEVSYPIQLSSKSAK